MAVQENNNIQRQTESDFIRISDILPICLAKWYWFAISIVLALCIAIVYILATPPVYTRSASLLIKEEGSSGQMGDAGVLGDFDIFKTNTNVNNEIQSLQSPSVMADVVRRLHDFIVKCFTVPTALMQWSSLTFRTTTMPRSQYILPTADK